MADIIQIRRDAAADWTSVDPTLAEGELGWETDTGKLKIGDGVTAWTALDYAFALSSYSDEWATTSASGGDTVSPDFATRELILCDCTPNPITVNLPASGSLTHKQGSIIKTDSSANAVTINANGAETINGEASITISYQHSAMTIICTGGAWRIF